MNYLFYGKDNGRIQKEITKVIAQYGDDCDSVVYDLNTVKMGEVMGDLMTDDEIADVRQIINNARATDDAELPPMI